MVAPLLAVLLAAAPARAAEIRVDADVSVPRVSPTVSPLTTNPSLSPSLAPSFAAPSLAAPALTPSFAAPSAAPALVPQAAPSALPAAAPALAPALTPGPALPAASVDSGDGAAASALTAGPVAPRERARSLLSRAMAWLYPTVIDGPDQSKDRAYYHGTSLARLDQAAAVGSLAANQTFVSNEPGFPYSYARGGARADGTAGVVLEFDKAALEDKIVPGHYSPSAQVGRERPVQLARFSRAVVDLPLTALTPASKKALLARYALERDLAPGDAGAATRLETLARAIGEPVPAARPTAAVEDLLPGRRVIVPTGDSGREAVYAGLDDGRAILIYKSGGAWADKKKVKLENLPEVVDAGPASEADLSAVAKAHGIDWSKAVKPASGAVVARKLDRDFAKIDFWAKVGPSARAEIEGLRARKLSKADLKAYVRKETDAAFARIKAARGAGTIAFHFNLHGGQRADYVGSGIRASKGDIALRYSMNGDSNDKVYMFRTDKTDAFDALDASNGEIMFFPSRMGHALNVFDLDAPELKAAMADGRITDVGNISMDFHKGMRGVPYSAYLAPPLEVFVGTAKKIGLRRVSRDEETLATVRFLEAALTRGGPFVPGGEAAADGADEAGADARARAAAAASPAHRIPAQFKLVDGAYFYHGTTLADLIRIVESGGNMAAEVSQFSLRARDSLDYAAQRRYALRRDDNPEVLLQFRETDLAPFVSNESFRPAMALTDRGMPPVHAAYAAATKPVPLALMTPESKRSLLAWLDAKAASEPGEPKWPALRAEFAAALSAR